MEEIKNNREYQKELFDRLKKSMSLKKEEECFGDCLNSCMWWIIEEPHPKSKSLKKLVFNTCPILKEDASHKKGSCINLIYDTVKKSGEDRSLVRFECPEDL